MEATVSGRERPTPQRRELEIMRVLFERRLKERAVALADSRWPGSGQMVNLAYEWGQLSPEQRRERLSAIGPEEIARLRAFAELNPSLASAITELERRGALPHIEAAVVDIAAASREASQPADEATPIDEPEIESEPTPEPETAETVEAETVDDSETHTYAEPEPVAEFPEDAAPSEDLGEPYVDPLEVDMPELDLGLPSTTEFLNDEARRREDLARSTEESMERVRQRLEQSARRAFERNTSVAPRIPEIPRPSITATAGTAFTATPSVTATASDVMAPKMIAAPRQLAKEFEEQVVVALYAGDPKPSDDELVALANDLQIGLSEHRITYENRKEEFGGLAREVGRISVRPGRLARAVAEPNLVVVRGRIITGLVERLEEGYLDIPGTRASVRLHPRTRVLLIAE